MSRLAAVEAGADIYFQSGRIRQALKAYEECYRIYEAHQQEKGMEKVSVRVEQCQLQLLTPPN